MFWHILNLRASMSLWVVNWTTQLVCVTLNLTQHFCSAQNQLHSRSALIFWKVSSQLLHSHSFVLWYINKAGGILKPSFCCFFYQIHWLVSVCSDSFSIYVPELCPSSEGKRDHWMIHQWPMTKVSPFWYLVIWQIKSPKPDSSLCCSHVYAYPLISFEDWCTLGCCQTLSANNIAGCKLR